ncbi:tether containing UBX domain for GLUT4 isoform X2 [Hypanus sabinus]|uniref:tether containing UBX domain for GLUT4 isoform X2 n=1 Tax=Hypanus sabinus TaxID=79690 RepID=UPI0028C4B21D|nr:tether containing UBX domain for GLUT4 isoform X2 [Hypanus sabinus]
MAASGVTTVTVLAPNGRRQQVKVAAGTPLLQVLEEVCRKQNLDPEEYTLKFQRTLLDLSQQWRFANVPNNAKLEMVTATRQRVGGAESKVRIALQLEDGSRLQHLFPSGLTLWDLLHHFPQTRITEQQLLESTPVCVSMRDEIAGENALRKTTLKSIGLTGGSAIIRYVLKKSIVDGQTELADLATVSDEQPVNKPNTVLTEAVDVSVAQSMDESGTNGLITEINSNGTVEVLAEQKVRSPSPEFEDTCQRKEGGKKLPAEEIRSEPSIKPSHGTEEPDVPELALPPASLQSSQLEKFKHQFTSDEPSKAATVSSSLAGPPHPKKSKTIQSSPKKPDDIRPLKLESSETSTAKEYLKPVDREALIFHLDNKSQEAPDFEELPDEFFQVTVDDVRKRFAQLKSERQFYEEAPLLTKSLRESQMREKTERYPKVVLRVQFPDRHVLQGFFRPLETVGALMEFVKMHLEDPDISFYLSQLSG